MTYALLAIIALLICGIVLQHRWAQDALERSHIRTTTYTQDLLDRLGAKDWQQYVDQTQGLSVYEEEGPTPTLEMVPSLGADRGGFGSRLGLRGWAGDPDATLEEE